MQRTKTSALWSNRCWKVWYHCGWGCWGLGGTWQSTSQECLQEHSNWGIKNLIQMRSLCAWGQWINDKYNLLIWQKVLKFVNDNNNDNEAFRTITPASTGDQERLEESWYNHLNRRWRDKQNTIPELGVLWSRTTSNATIVTTGVLMNSDYFVN